MLPATEHALSPLLSPEPGYESDCAPTTTKDESSSSVTVSECSSPNPPTISTSAPASTTTAAGMAATAAPTRVPEPPEPVILPFRRDDAVQGVVPLCTPRAAPAAPFVVRVEPAPVPGGCEELVMLTSDSVTLEVMVLPVSPFYATFIRALRNSPMSDGSHGCYDDDEEDDEEDEDDFECKYVLYSAVLTVAGTAFVLELTPRVQTDDTH